MIDTNVLVAGVSSFREPFVPGRNPSSDLLHDWFGKRSFVWLLDEDILDEYKEVLKRLGVRRNRIETLVNLIRERQRPLCADLPWNSSRPSRRRVLPVRGVWKGGLPSDP